MDLRKLKSLIDLVSDSEISELEISEGEDRVKIVRSSKKQSVTNNKQREVARNDISLNEVSHSIAILATKKASKSLC